MAKFIIKENVVSCMLEYASDRPELAAAATALSTEGGVIELPAENVVCPRCRGEGTHDHPAFSNGFTRDDEFVDDEFIEQYMAGAYDVSCSVCNGNRVIPEVDESRLNAQQKVAYDYQKDWWRSEAEYRREVEAERRMGA